MNNVDGKKEKTNRRGKKGYSAADINAHFMRSFDVIVKHAKIGLWEWNLLAGEVVYSPVWEEILGYEPGELVSAEETWQKVVLPEDLAYVNRSIQEYLEGKADGYEAEFRMVQKDGTVIWVQDTALITAWDSDGTPSTLLGELRDITRIKSMEQKLKDKSEVLDFAIAATGIGVYDWDIANNRVDYNDELLTMLGYARGEISGTPEEWESFIHPEDQKKASTPIDAYIRGKNDSYRREIRVRRKDGRYLWMADSGRIVEWDEDEKPKRLIGGHLNIDKLKRAEEATRDALRENERYSEQLMEEIQTKTIKLHEFESINDAVMDANPYICVIWDENIRPIDCNPATLKFFGYDDKEKLLADMLPMVAAALPKYQPNGERSRGIMARFDEAVQTGSCEFETEFEFNDQRIPFRGIFKKIDYNHSFAIVAYMIDLRSLKEAKNEIMRQDNLLKAVNTAASILMDAEPEVFDTAIFNALQELGRTVQVDRMYIWENYVEGDEAWCRQIYEWSEGAEPQQGKEITAGIPYSAVPYWYEEMGEGRAINAYVRNLPKEEREVLEPQGVISILVIPVFLHGDFWGFVGFDDCSKDRVYSHMEEGVLHSGAMIMVSAILRNDMMENLIEAKEVALANTRAKTRFLANMSHEIRTPMNAIIGMNAIAQKTNDLAKIQYCMHKIEGASGQLLSIINDILDMSKIEADKLELVPHEFSFEKMMQNVFNVINVKVEEKHQNFTFDFKDVLGRNIISDDLRLSQVFINLLTNAVKFTPDGGDINLLVKKVSEDGKKERLHVEVRDSGIGMSEEEQQKLFTSFEQADSSITRRFGGTGLGLAICKSIVTLMNGDIWVNSAPGEGSTFLFEVEVGIGGEAASPNRSSTLRDNLKILVVDDNEDVRIYFRDILDSFAMSCDIAENGQQAVEFVQKAKEQGEYYDLIFIDWKMPGISGVAAASEIRRITQGEGEIVLISVADWTDVEQEAKSAGITQFLAKPVRPSVLFNTILELTERPEIDMQDKYAKNHDRWKGRHILLAEDIEINREIIHSILDDTGVKIDSAENGAKAVEMFAENSAKYDLILMDIQMPEMDGLAATEKIRSLDLKEAVEIPIIAMTANAFKEDIADCLRSGMNDHIAKPVDIDALMQKLSGYLDMKK
ncbi:MAG: response regulator [Christensenellaceae bacterium]